MFKITKLELIAKNLSTKRLSFRSLNDIRAFRRRSTRSLKSFRSFMRAEIARRLPPVTYEYKLKMFAIHMVVTQLSRQMRILRNINKSQLGKFLYVNCPEKIFTWSLEDWFDTLPYRLMWYNLLSRQMPSHVLNKWLKSKKLKAIENGIEAIYRAYISERETALDAMKPIVKFHNIEKDVTEELKESTIFSDDTRKMLRNVEYTQKGWTSLQLEPEDTYLIAKIEYKYMLDYSKVKEEEVAYRNHLAEKYLNQQIHQYKRRMSTDQFASSCTKDAYFNEIAILRERINKMTKRYDSEYQRLDGDITYLNAAIEKLHINRTFLLENIEWFKQTRDSVDSMGMEIAVQRSRKRFLKQIPRFSKESSKKLDRMRRSTSMLSTRSQRRKILLPRTKAKRRSSTIVAANQE